VAILLLQFVTCILTSPRLCAASLLLVCGSETEVVREGRAMHRISFDNNSMTGTIPGFLIHYPSLLLALPDNELTGTLPDWTNNLMLQELNLRGNRLHGTLPILFTG
jgi:hypothetical protein